MHRKLKIPIDADDFLKAFLRSDVLVGGGPISGALTLEDMDVIQSSDMLICGFEINKRRFANIFNPESIVDALSGWTFCPPIDMKEPILYNTETMLEEPDEEEYSHNEQVDST